MNLADFRQFYSEQKIKIQNLYSSKDTLEECLSQENSTLSDQIEARDIMNSIGIIAQDSVKTIIEDLVTKALQTVFDDTYSLVILNQVSRNKPETVLLLKIGDQECPLREDLVGGGVLDVVGFVLRVVLWAFEEKKSRNTIILDEPGKFISKDKLELFGCMIKEISESLNLQFIIITHEEELIEAADIAYLNLIEQGVSRTELL